MYFDQLNYNQLKVERLKKFLEYLEAQGDEEAARLVERIKYYIEFLEQVTG